MVRNTCSDIQKIGEMIKGQRYTTMRAGWKVLGALLLAALTVPAWGLKAVPPPATLQAGAPGTLNYVEGQARLGDEPLNSDAIGGVILQAGETLSTSTGKAEILL